MANLTLPDANSEFAKCPHCGAAVTINPIWFQALQRLLKLINASL